MQWVSLPVSCRTLNGLLELVKGVGKIQGSKIHEVSLIPNIHHITVTELLALEAFLGWLISA